EAQEDGTLKQEETKLIRSVIEFDDLEVGDILTPRINIAAVDEKDSMKEIQKIFESTGYSRLPVYKESIDTIIGTIHEKDFYNSYITDKKNIKDIMQNAFYTTKHTKISNLLKQLQKQKIHMAIVLDEYGGTLGIVTMEDILEELVGEIFDEHDEEVSYFKTISENTFIIDGHAPLNKTFEINHFHPLKIKLSGYKI
ncbi:MAG: CBS domain-containing protein, partial [Treponema sp.]|nr:CBS domain-containing protein [Treponema sp.]